MDCLTTTVNVGAVGLNTALQAGRWRVPFPAGSFGFYIDYINRVESTMDVSLWIKEAGG